MVNLYILCIYDLFHILPSLLVLWIHGMYPSPVCVSDCTYEIIYDMMVSKSVSMSTPLVTPDSLSPSPSNSAHMKTPDPQALIFQHP